MTEADPTAPDPSGAPEQHSTSGQASGAATGAVPVMAAPAEERNAGRSPAVLLSILVVLGFAAVSGAGYWAWQHPPAASRAQNAAPDNLVASAASAHAIAALNARLTRLEQTPPVATLDSAALNARLDALSAAEKSLASRQDGGSAAITARLDGIETRLAALEQSVQAAQAEAQHAARRARLAEAAAALAIGAPLGPIEGAPAALARFATTAPPSLAALRQSFPEAAQAALAASNPVPPDTPFLRGLWLRAQSLVTLRHGQTVVLGNQAAGAIATARTALDAGDLPATLAALDGLDGPAKAAIAPWRDQAAALLAARTALAAAIAGPTP